MGRKPSNGHKDRTRGGRQPGHPLDRRLGASRSPAIGSSSAGSCRAPRSGNTPTG